MTTFFRRLQRKQRKATRNEFDREWDAYLFGGALSHRNIFKTGVKRVVMFSYCKGWIDSKRVVTLFKQFNLWGA